VLPPLGFKEMKIKQNRKQRNSGNVLLNCFYVDLNGFNLKDISPTYKTNRSFLFKFSSYQSIT
jgi:hypothetical protein